MSDSERRLSGTNEAVGALVQTVLDPVAADLRVGKGTLGWAGGAGVNVDIDPQEQIVSLFMVQTPAGAMPRDFENTVWQAIVE